MALLMGIWNSILLMERIYYQEFDAILSSQVLHWMLFEEKIATFNEILKSLKPNGYFLFSTPSTDHHFNFLQFLPMLPAKVCQEMGTSFFLETKDTYQTILNQIGFQRISISKQRMEFPFSSLDDALKWFASSVHNSDFHTILELLQGATKTNNIDFMYDVEGNVVYKSGMLSGKCQKPPL